MKKTSALYATSIKQASKLWHIPEPELLRAKHGGCAGYRGARIYRKEVEAWVVDHPLEESGLDPETKEELEKLRIKKTNELLQLRIDEQKGRLMEVSKAQAGWTQGLEIIMGVMKTFMNTSTYNQAIKQMQAGLRGMDI